MAEIETAVYSALTGNATVAGLVGSRVYPLVAPQDVALPLLVYQRISQSPVVSHSGHSNLARTRIQVMCVAVNYNGARALAAAVQGALHTLRAQAADPRIDVILLDNERDEFSDVDDLYSVQQDYIVWHYES